MYRDRQDNMETHKGPAAKYAIEQYNNLQV